MTNHSRRTTPSPRHAYDTDVWRRANRRGLAALLMAALIGATLTTTAGTSVSADHGCNVARWPDFARIAPSARRIIVGTVTEPLRDIREFADVRDYPLSDPSESFRLRVDEVLRGRAPQSIKVSHLRSGLPRRDPRRECGKLEAKVGDRLVLAFDGRLPGRARRINTAAWIEGDPSISNQPAGQLTLGQARRLAGHAPDGSTLPHDRGIRRAAMSVADLPAFIAESLDNLMRLTGDAQARRACGPVLGELSEIDPASEATLVAAYRMSGQEQAEYAERLWSLGHLVERASDGYSMPLDVCIFDGNFSSHQSGRALALVSPDAPPSWGFAICDKNEIPIDYDRPDPTPWPEAMETWC